MSNFLDIIVPEYECKDEFMDRLIKSIIRQKMIDLREIGLLIVNDNSIKKFKNGFFRKYPQLHIKYYLKETNDGVGMTRQFGLEMSSAKYVTFVDQDDELFGDESLFSVINYLKTNEPEVLLTKYVEEIKNGEKIEYKIYNSFDVKETLHGVFINRDSFINNGIKFVKGVRFHDDFYMRRILTTILLTSELDIISYVWKYNEKSQVRVDRISYQVRTFDDLFRAVEARIDFFDSKCIYVNELSVSSILMLFCILEYDDFSCCIEKKKLYEKKLYELICKNSDKFESVKENFDLYYDSQYEYYKNTRMGVNRKLDFYSFVTNMGNEYTEIKYSICVRIKILRIYIFYRNNGTLLKTLDSILCQKNIDRSLYEVIIVGHDEDIELSDKYRNGIYGEFIKIKTNYLCSNKTKNEFINESSGCDYNYVTFLEEGNVLYEYTTLYKLRLQMSNFKNESLIFKVAKFENGRIKDNDGIDKAIEIYNCNNKTNFTQVSDYFLVVKY